MTSFVNSSVNAAKSFNTGYGRAIKEFGPVTGIIAALPGTILDATARADLKTYFSTKAKTDLRTSRFYAYHGLVGWEEANGDAKSESLPNGLSKYVGDGKPTYTLRFDGGGMAQHLMMRNLKNAHQTFEFFFIHETGELGGTVVKNASGSFDLGTIKLHQLWAGGRKFANGSNGESTMLMMTLNNTLQVNENYGYIDLDFDIVDATKGITDVRLVVTNLTSTKWKVELLAGYTSQDLTAYYPTELTDVACYVVKNKTAVTTLTVSAAATKTGYMELTLSAAPTAGHKLTFDLAAISVLEGELIFGHESLGPVEVTQPA